MRFILLLLLLGLGSFTFSDAFAYTITDDSTGGDCSTIGIWDSGSKTCTLSGDVDEGIVIGNNGITLDGDGHTVTGPGTTNDAGYGIHLNVKTNIIIKNIIVKDFLYGIFLQNSVINEIKDNTSLNNWSSQIRLEDSNDNIISNNILTGLENGYGILIGGTNNNVHDNTVTLNEVGIRSLGDDTTISNNIVENNKVGIDGTKNSLIEGNTVNNNSAVGIELGWGIDGSTVNNNIISNNELGLNLFGTNLIAFDNEISNNVLGLQLGHHATVYHNNLISNTVEAKMDQGSIASFNTSISDGGNYWSDYSPNCSDENHDNFCDESYPFKETMRVDDEYIWTVQDGWLTTINTPNDVTLDATDASGIIYDYSVSAIHDGSSMPVTCDVISGSTFPIGVTGVLCTANNGIKDTFSVIVEPLPPFIALSSIKDNDISTPYCLGYENIPAGTNSVWLDGSAQHNLSSDITSMPTAHCSSDPYVRDVFFTATTDTSPPNDSNTIAVTPTITVNQQPIIVPDTIPPVVVVPNNMAITVTSNNPSPVTFSVTSTDDTDGPLTPSCSYNSGYSFPIGVTTVTCTATDNAGNTKSESFSITVTYDDLTTEPEPEPEPTPEPDGNSILIKNTRITNAFGATISEITENTEFHLTADLTNISNISQSFVYFVEFDSEESWINGQMTSGQTLTPSITLSSESSGTHYYKIRIYDNLNQKNELAEHVSGYVKVIDFSSELTPPSYFELYIETDDVNIFNIREDNDFNSLLFDIDVISSGASIEVTIPRVNFDSEYNDVDDDFVVLVDGNDPNDIETKTTSQYRTLHIELPIGSEEIEIIGSKLTGTVSNDLPIYGEEYDDDQSDSTITVKTNRSTYENGDNIVISGFIRNLAEYSQSVTMVVVSPIGDIVSIMQVTPTTDGKFSTTIKAGATMNVKGDYEIRAQYGAAKTTNTFYYSGGSAPTPEPTPEPYPEQDDEVIIVPASGSGAPGCEETSNGCYLPEVASIAFGGKVIFSNTDSAAHTFTSGTPGDGPTGIFDTGLLMANNSYNWTANENGQVPYFCMVHPWMEGLILVGEGTQRPQPTPQSDDHIDLEVSSENRVYDINTIAVLNISIENNVKSQNVALDITDPRGTTVISRSVSLGPDDSISYEYKIDENAKAGNYKVTVTTSDGNRTEKDTTHFKVKSQFNSFKITSVEITDQKGNPSDLKAGETGFIKVNTNSNKSIATLVTVNIFDSELTSIGIGSVQTTLSSGGSEMILSFNIPSDAATGPAEIFVNAFSDWPSEGGIPLTHEFAIEKSIGNTSTQTSTPTPEPQPTPEPEADKAAADKAAADKAASNSIEVNINKSSYSEGETILVTGKVRDLYPGTPVSVIVIAPSGDLVSIAQVSVGTDKKFSTEVTAGGALMGDPGTYKINVQYGTENRSAETTFEFGGSTIPTNNIPDSSVTDTTVSVSGTNELIEYTITGGKLLNVIPDKDGNSLILSLDVETIGILTLSIPRVILDATYNGGDDDFFVLADREEIDFTESKSSSERKLFIGLQPGIKEIVIVGTYVI